MKDTFFTQQNCDRCKKDLHIRTMSWFTAETICGDCSDVEKQIRSKLPENGRQHEGCGYVPKFESGIVNISAMFHDDSFEGYNFWKVTRDDSEFLGGGEAFKKNYPELVKQVEEAMAKKEIHISLDDGNEIQWG